MILIDFIFSEKNVSTAFMNFLLSFIEIISTFTKGSFWRFFKKLMQKLTLLCIFFRNFFFIAQKRSLGLVIISFGRSFVMILLDLLKDIFEACWKIYFKKVAYSLLFTLYFDILWSISTLNLLFLNILSISSVVPVNIFGFSWVKYCC